MFIGNVSPAAKKRAKGRLLDEKENLPRGSITKLKELGINLSNNYISSSSTSSALQKEIEEFMPRQRQQTGTRQKNSYMENNYDTC